MYVSNMYISIKTDRVKFVSIIFSIILCHNMDVIKNNDMLIILSMNVFGGWGYGRNMGTSVIPDAIRINININVTVMYRDSIDGIIASNSAIPMDIMTHNVSYIF